MKKKILILLSVICIISIGAYFAAVHSHSQNENASYTEETVQPTENDETESIDITWNTYDVYQSDLFDFDFIIANVHVESQDTINITLDTFETDEGVFLSQYQQYVSVLEENSYYLGKKNVWFSIVSSTNTFDGNLFIPVLDKDAQVLSVSYTFENEHVQSFDLTKNHRSIDELMYYRSDEIMSDGITYQLQVSNAFEVSKEEMYQDGSNMLLPSSARVFALKVEAESLSDDFTIDQAVFESEDGWQLSAEDLSVSSMKYENIIGKTIQDEMEGCLFFILLDPDHDPFQYSGILKLTISDSDTPIEINVSVEGE